MSKKIPKEISTLLIGFLGGILPGISIKTGISLDPSDWSVRILKGICRITEERISFNCYALVLLVPLIVTFVTFFLIWRRVSKIKKVKIKKLVIPGFVIGLILYFIGLMLGALFVMGVMG